MSATHKHHRKRRSQGGDDSYGNLIELPMEVHELVHASPEVAYRHGLLVHSYDNPSEIRPDIHGFLSELGIEMADPKKRRNYPKDSEERRNRKRVTIAVPEDRENGGQLWDEILSAVKLKLDAAGLINPDNYPDPQKYPAYEALIAALWDWLTDA